MSRQIQKLEGDNFSSTPNLDQSGKPVAPIDLIRNTLIKQKSEFVKVLPSHISFEKFQRTVMTALIQNPALIQAERQSLMLSCIKAASDGLLPDARDAALVIFNSKIKDESGKDVWVNKVQYMPMWSGILKKIRQSKEVSSVVAHVVYKRDKFEYVLGDEERIVHEPYMPQEGEETSARGPIIAAYAIAKLKDGMTVREVMTLGDIEKIRRASKAGAKSDKDVKYSGGEIGDPKGIWKEWYEEMARKTVFRRLAKWLPQSIELVDNAFGNDDTMDILSEATPDAPTMISHAASAAAGETVDEDGVIEHEQETEKKQPDLKAAVKEKNERAAPKKDAADEHVAFADQLIEKLNASKTGDELTEIWLDGGDLEGPDQEKIKDLPPEQWNRVRALHDKLAIQKFAKP